MYSFMQLLLYSEVEKCPKFSKSSIHFGFFLESYPAASISGKREAYYSAKMPSGLLRC